MTKDEALKAIGDLRARLTDLKRAPQKSEEINMFTALNLQSAERHHSSFFAGLLSPSNPHRLGDAAIRKFLYYLWDDAVREETYKPPKGQPRTVRSRSNIDILRQIAQDRQSLVALSQGEIVVKTEVYTNSNGAGQRAGYIDILVEVGEKSERADENREASPGETSSGSPSEVSLGTAEPLGVSSGRNSHVKTVIAIENKTVTETHSDQLCKYESYIDAEYPASCKKIFVLLSPFGSIPINRGGDEQYNGRYCIFDYGETNGVCKILEEILSELKNMPMTPAQRRKIKMILGDYKTMTQKDILATDPQIRKEIKALHDDFRDLLSLIVNFYDNVPDLLDYSDRYLAAHLAGYRLLARNESSLVFTTKRLEDRYACISEKMTVNNVYRISTDGQSELKYVIQAKVFPKDKTDPSRSGSIEKWEQRGEKITGQFEKQVEGALDVFLRRILFFEGKLPKTGGSVNP